ncbi:MAG: SpoIIE family protein phosphatase [Desulfobacterales bacterium]|nr:MAG: SpoIIE family protein phosphatase [Desulfobacterales bacterium]
MNEINSLKKELNKLKSEKAAFQAQSKLLENFVALARSTDKEKMLGAFLQTTLDVSAELTAAEKGSLFLLAKNGVVTDSILTRSDATPEQRSQLIGSVLDKGLAGWVRRHRQIGLIADTSDDDRWLDLPNQPYTVGSALAVPILRGEDLLGILTLLHAQPGHFDTESAELMKMTAVQIGSALENASLYAKLDESYRSLEQAKIKIEAYSKALDAEMEKGRKIQMDFLPHKIPYLPGWEIAYYFHPARQVSGDFYDAFILPDGLLGMVIADVCDKGVGSALFMALFRSLIRVFSGQISLRGVSFSAIDEKKRETHDDESSIALQAVALTNEYIAEEHGQEGMFVTLFFGVLNPKTGNMAYVNAGHEPIHIIGPSGEKETLTTTGPVIGMMPNANYNVKKIMINPGDTLIGYTDGVTEAHSPENKLFTKERFLSIIKQPAPSAFDLIERIKTELFHHINQAPQFDDITMLAIHREPDN